MPPTEPIKTALQGVNRVYANQDAEEFDYQLFKRYLLNLRGPEWDSSEHADLNLVGSARVFGRFVAEPMSQILTERHGIVSRNIGYSGCTPTSIFENPELMDYLRNSPGLPVVQLCALDGGASDWYIPARSRRVYLTLDGVTAKNKMRQRALLRMGHNVELFAKKHGLKPQRVRNIMKNNVNALPDDIPIFTIGRAGHLMAVIAETRSPEECVEQMRKTQDWAYAQYARLVEELGRPAVLLSFYAEERPKLDPSNVMDIALSFPQFADADFCERVGGLFSEHVKVVGKSGASYVKPGAAEAYNEQYPTAEMHQACAEQIQTWFRSRS